MDEHHDTPLTGLTEDERQQALFRYKVLRLHVEEDVPLARLAVEHGVPIRTARRWLHNYRLDGLSGLTRKKRCDAGTRKLPAGFVSIIEGLALTKPCLPASVTEEVVLAATKTLVIGAT